MNILETAHDLTAGDRQEIYGHPADNYERLAAVWSALTGYKFSAIGVQQMLIAMKLVRAGTSPDHIDTLVDIAGYARTIQMTIERGNDNETSDSELSDSRAASYRHYAGRDPVD